MGLVDYSDSESDSETLPPTAQARKTTNSEDAASSKASKPFHKLVSRDNPSKIIVNLPTASAPDSLDRKNPDEPPAKRVRTGGGGRFSSFSSFLPPPKTTGKPSLSAAANKTAPRPGVHLKTGAEPAFSREAVEENDRGESDDLGPGPAAGLGSGLKLPPPKDSGPSIPAEQKPAEEVKLVGKPLMFKPLSVARKPAKKKTNGANGVGVAAGKAKVVAAAAVTESKNAGELPKKKKVSLFSIGNDTPASGPAGEQDSSGAYEPLFGSANNHDDGTTESPYDDLDTNYSSDPSAFSAPTPQQAAPSLSTMADDLNLSAAARRELFGRGGAPALGPAPNVISFDMEREYAHNEAVRAAGDTVVHNPVRAIAPGKHSLRQIVNAVQNNRSALEDSFATARSNKNEAAGRYGWR